MALEAASYQLPAAGKNEHNENPGAVAGSWKLT